MNSLSWNCRGNPRTVRALRDLVQRWNPRIIFLMETKASVRRMTKVKERIGFPNGLVVPSEGKSGGIALLWIREVEVEIKSFSRSHIDAVVTDHSLDLRWRLTGFYRNPDTNLRRESWNLLRMLNSQYQMPWMCMGDYNEILFATEKCGGLERSQNQMEGFRSVINECGFQDMGYVGPKFTWYNRRSDGERIRLRLDTVLSTADWMELYRTSKVFHIVDSTSEHCALLLTDQQASPNRGKRQFHFEAAWIRYEKCKEIIQEVWKNHSGLHSSSGLVEGLNDCASGLARWNYSDLGHIPRKIQEKRKSLQAMIQADLDGSNGEEIDKMRKEINELLDVEETKWHQRSRVQWYQKGDRNTQFFQHKASQCKKKKNEINGLWDKEGKWC